MRKDSLAVAALATWLLLPGCAWLSKSPPAASHGPTPDQAAAMLSGSGDALGNNQASFWQKMTRPITHAPVAKSLADGWHHGAGKVRQLANIKPQIKPAPDPISLAQKPDLTNPDLQTSLAIMAENAGRAEQAASHLNKALAHDPKNLKALLTYAHLLERQGRLPEALSKYEQAIQAHPNSSQALNDLGLCLARTGRVTEALQPLGRAIELQPQRPLYRNNMATVLTELGRTDEALAHLKVVHPLPVAHYNLGTLLHRRNQNQQAAQQFAQASALDPSFTAARDMATQLGSLAPYPIPVSYTPAGSPASRTAATNDASIVGDRYRNVVAP